MTRRITTPTRTTAANPLSATTSHRPTTRHGLAHAPIAAAGGMTAVCHRDSSTHREAANVEEGMTIQIVTEIETATGRRTAITRLLHESATPTMIAHRCTTQLLRQ